MRSQAVFEEFLTESEAPIPEALDLRCVLVAAPDLYPILGEAFHPYARFPNAPNPWHVLSKVHDSRPRRGFSLCLEVFAIGTAIAIAPKP